VWRIPPWQPALLILLATGLIALELYADLSVGARIMNAVIAAASLIGACLALRYLLVADTDGIWVRRLVHEELVEWDDVANVDVTLTRRNASTVRVTRRNGSYVDVPPSLVLPTVPTSIRKARSLMSDVARTLLGLAAQQSSTSARRPDQAG
jgi:hypothetical protein